MTTHAIAKIKRAEVAAQAAGLTSQEWQDMTWIWAIIAQVYNTEPPSEPVLIRGGLPTMISTAQMVYAKPG